MGGGVERGRGGDVRERSMARSCGIRVCEARRRRCDPGSQVMADQQGLRRRAEDRQEGRRIGPAQTGRQAGDEAAHAAAPQRQFLIGHDEHTQRIVTQDELMALAAEQFPAGLVPVGIDEEADELPREVEPTLTSVTETVADEDYSYLV